MTAVYYDKAGIAITALEWRDKVADMDYKRVGLTYVTSATDPDVAYRVSTVWLGMDHGLGMGAPVLFETMVFQRDGMSELDCRRYCTLAQADVGHAEQVTLVAATVTDPIITDA